MHELPNYFYEKMAVLLENQPKGIFYLLRNCYLIGSTVASSILDLENDNDIDIYYYENSKNKNRNMRKLYTSLSLSEILNIDLLPYIITDNFHSSSGKCLTDYIFDEKKEAFSKKAGQIRALNFEGLFMTKLAALSCRDERRDKMAIKAIIKEWDNVLPKDVKTAIENFNLAPFYEEFK
jgi:hypothetical protein